MLIILCGHLLGLLVTLTVFKNTVIEEESSAGFALTYLALFGIFLFVEYQLIRSIQSHSIYFRGNIEKSEGSKFTRCQFAYAVQGGFCVTFFVKSILL